MKEVLKGLFKLCSDWEGLNILQVKIFGMDKKGDGKTAGMAVIIAVVVILVAAFLVAFAFLRVAKGG